MRAAIAAIACVVVSGATLADDSKQPPCITDVCTGAKDETPLVGVAKRDVTPTAPVVLAGFAGRTTEHEGIDATLWARALVLGPPASPAAVLVAIDNCGVPRTVRDRVARRVEEEHGIDPGRLVVAATHTHNAPALAGYAAPVWCDRFPDGAERRMHAYTAFAVDQMVAAIGAALAHRQPMTLEWGEGMVPFAGNRRVVKKSGLVTFGSNVYGKFLILENLFSRLDALLFTATDWIFIPAYCFAIP